MGGGGWWGKAWGQGACTGKVLVTFCPARNLLILNFARRRRQMKCSSFCILMRPRLTAMGGGFSGGWQAGGGGKKEKKEEVLIPFALHFVIFLFHFISPRCFSFFCIRAENYLLLPLLSTLGAVYPGGL